MNLVEGKFYRVINKEKEEEFIIKWLGKRGDISWADIYYRDVQFIGENEIKKPYRHTFSIYDNDEIEEVDESEVMSELL